MKTIFLFVIILFNCLFIIGQNNYENLRKYWYYRERFKKFVLVSPNYNEKGTNLPFDRINWNTLYMDDGNGTFNQYISVLATEYRLLKNSGQDYTQTIKELYYAIKSFERMDRIAESLYREINTGIKNDIRNEDLNGLFVRNDVDSAFKKKYELNFFNYYVNVSPFNVTGLNFEANSLDNCINNLESFALVNALVDNEYVDGSLINFRELIKANTKRMIQHMQHQDDPLEYSIVIGLNKFEYSYDWYLKNPATDDYVEEGDGRDGTMLFASYGLAQAANNILGTSEFSGMEYSNKIFKSLLPVPLGDLHISLGVYLRSTLAPVPGILYNDIDIKAFSNTPPWSSTLWSLLNYPNKVYIPNPLCPFICPDIEVPAYETIGSKTWQWDVGDISDKFRNNLIGIDYKIRSLCATGNISTESGLNPYKVLISKQTDPIKKHEHLPLIWSILNNNFGFITDNDRAVIKSLLNDAPTCGPYKIKLNNGTIVKSNSNWSCGSRLKSPNSLDLIPENGDDEWLYMGIYNGLDYMLLHNLYWLSNKQYPDNLTFDQTGGLPLNGIAKNQVISNASIDLTKGSVCLLAGNKVILNSGFSVSVSSGKTFTANVTSMTAGEGPIFFRKVSISDYPQCGGTGSLKSAKLNDDTLKFNPFENISIIAKPNPFINIVDLVSSSDFPIRKVEVYSLMGIKIKEFKFKDLSNVSLDLSSCLSGVYTLRITDSENNSNIIKIVKQ